jgi:hypothetical protein
MNVRPRGFDATMAPQLENPLVAAALSLLTPQAVRTRAHRMLTLGLEDALPHFRIDLDRLDVAVDLVLEVTRTAYPTLDVPFHSRWRHFIVNGQDLWASLDAATKWKDRFQRARAAFDLAIVSVLLDAGAGADWHYTNPQTGARITRSEGLALASLDLFSRGVFSTRPGDPLRVDADALQCLTYDALRTGLQVSNANPLVGLKERVDLLCRLGAVLAASPDVFAQADTPRPGGLFDFLAAQACDCRIQAAEVLKVILRQFGAIWPSRLTLGGIALGDCWQHPSLASAEPTSALVPLHKLSMWLAYSLIEPICTGGISVLNVDALTGLAEYRNGGLLVDTGVLLLRDMQDARHTHDVSSTLVVEWRALTVALLDRLAQRLRKRLGMNAVSLPLAKILQGGTWAAGRRIARERRADGSPPLHVRGDGTVF